MLSGCSTRPVVSPPLPSSFLGSAKAFLSSSFFPDVNRCPVLSVNKKVKKYGAISRFNNEEDTPPDPKTSVLALILGGGKGTRLYPLTKSRAKPAVPLGANYRLIDIPVSNCINSDITKIYVLTQFNSTSLNSHIYRAYSGNMIGFRDDSFVEVLAAEQTLENQLWFQGTADAVRQYLWLFEDPTVKEFLILAGDHLYRMDYQLFIKHHRRSKADITVAAVPVSEEKATSLGLMKLNPDGDIIQFAEKPEGSALKAMKVDTTILGLDDEKAKEMPYIASMGIYVISKEAMMNLLLKKFPDANDFGSQIIPGATEVGMKVQAYLFHGYWEDIGTIKSFYDANIGMTKNTPVFRFYDKKSPIYTLPRCLAPSKVSNAHVSDSVIGEGCHIKDCRILHSVIGLRSQISAGAVIEDTLLMGADYYETQEEQDAILSCGGIPVGVGKHSHVRKAIVDKNARIGEHVKIMNTDNVLEAAKELQGFYIKDGIVVILKDALISNGTVI